MKKSCITILSALSILGLAACNNDKGADSTPNQSESKVISIVAPSGAPALSHVKLAYDAKMNNDYTIAGYKINFETVNGADGVKAAITSKSHDIVLAPINLGATLYKSNQTYQYAANITDGNLYFASTTAINSFSDLKDKNLVFFGENTINQAVVNQILDENQISKDKVTYLAATSDTQAQLVANQNENTVYLVAEPVLTAAKIKLASQNITVNILDIQKEFKRINDGMDFLQAGVFINKNLNSEFVAAYLSKLEEGINFVNENKALASQYAQDLELGLPSSTILEKAIPGCNLNFRLATNAKSSFTSLASLGLNYFGGSLPDESFYYQA